MTGGERSSAVKGFSGYESKICKCLVTGAPEHDCQVLANLYPRDPRTSTYSHNREEALMS